MIGMRGLAVAMFALIWKAPAWAGGYVYDTGGDVFVAVGKGAVHAAAKNETIASDTMISTGDKSYVVLKFEDGQVVTMQSNSTFHVRQYEYEPQQVEKSNIFFSMLKGGMRFVTGLIGQRNKDAFRLVTPTATIGIRGTDFMVAMVDSSMYSQVVSGSIGMSNAAGTAVFTAGQTAATVSATTLPTAIPAAAVPAGTFSQLVAIPVPPTAPAPASAGGAASGSTAGGAETGGATTAATAGVSTGVTATTVGIGVVVAAGVAAIASNTSTTTHH